MSTTTKTDQKYRIKLAITTIDEERGFLYGVGRYGGEDVHFVIKITCSYRLRKITDLKRDGKSTFFLIVSNLRRKRSHITQDIYYCGLLVGYEI